MATEKLKSFAPILWAFVIITISIPFIVANENTLSQYVSAQQSNNETVAFTTAIINANSSINESKSFTVTYTPVKTSNLSLVSFTLTNASGSLATVNTDYVVNLSAGSFTFKNTSIWEQNRGNNNSIVSYQYYANGYIQNTGAVSILSLIDFICALMVLIAIVGYFYKEKLFEVYENLTGG